ncbi:MAG TPA: hypothetical protein ACFYEE_01305 [Candidatus Wujingus californicus]|uniref:hypothetical protein n=1 Tax=Candidatus Wujingus californicus TaxID=3367618 RepID=UPI002713CF21|nr:hypothetical protein [Candidatus Brocadiales bacterium]
MCAARGSDQIKTVIPITATLDYYHNIITKGDGVTVPEHFCEDVLEAFIQINDVFDNIFKERSN